MTAVVYGLLCHLSFAAGVGLMLRGLFDGLQSGVGSLTGPAALVANGLLVLQFPLLHSYLLGPGRRWLTRAAPGSLGRDLATTTFATFASLQLVAVFLLWSPSGVVLWEASGPWLSASYVAYGLSWLLVMKTMGDAGLGTQLGYTGWFAVARGQKPAYSGFPERGSFKICRQPIYLAFALTLWTGPVLTLDRLALAVALTGYCLLGPVLKERRYQQRYGEAFARYQARVPFWPTPWRRPQPEQVAA